MVYLKGVGFTIQAPYCGEDSTGYEVVEAENAVKEEGSFPMSVPSFGITETSGGPSGSSPKPHGIPPDRVTGQRPPAGAPPAVTPPATPAPEAGIPDRPGRGRATWGGPGAGNDPMARDIAEGSAAVIAILLLLKAAAVLGSSACGPAAPACAAGALAAVP